MKRILSLLLPLSLFAQVSEVKVNPNTGALISPSAATFKSANGITTFDPAIPGAIGGTTPAAAAFTNVTASGTGIFGSILRSNGIQFGGGNEAAGQLTLLEGVTYFDVSGNLTLRRTSGGNAEALSINGTTGATNLAGPVTIGGVAVPTISSTSTLTNKTINGTSNTITVRLGSDVTGTLPVANGGAGKANTDPGIAYFRTNGSNVSGDGSPGNPYAANGGQTAYDAGFKYFDIGANLDIGVIHTTSNETLFFRGAGKNSQVYVATRGWDLVIWDMAGISVYLGCSSNDTSGARDSGNIEVYHGYVGNCYTDGQPGTASTPARNAGNLTLYGPMACSTVVTAFGGTAYDDGSTPQDGGNGGVIVINYGVKFLPTAAQLSATGGGGVNGGNVGAPGSITLRGCDTGAVTADPVPTTRIGAIENGVFYP